ncbi:dNMP kinase [Citromicrobium phage vB_CbaS-RXM]|nr:dNMP kinase [Citromicrobium phage vB_CbaS-RXM]
MTHSASTLIGLTGGKGSGKDTMASVLLQRDFANLKFAGALKAMLAELLRYQGADEDTIARMIEGDLKEVPTDLLAGQTPRWAMQTLGTEWGRELIGENLWVDATMNKAATLPQVVITDVRFLNELEAVRTAGGRVIRIEDTSEGRTSDTHESEAHIAELPVDATFKNDKLLGVELGRDNFAYFLATCEEHWMGDGA